MSRRVLATGDELQFLVFRLGQQEFALSIAQAERILRYEAGAVIAGGPRFLDGFLPFRDTTVPLLDLRRRVGGEPTDREETRVMVLALDGVALALVVDQVTEVLRVDTRTILEGTTPVSGIPAAAVGGSIPRPGRNIVILNAPRLLTGAQRVTLSEGRT